MSLFFNFFLHWSLSVDESALVTTIGYIDDSQRCSNWPESLLIVTHKSLSVPCTNDQIRISSERRSSRFLRSPGFLSDPRASLGFYSTELQAWRIITIDLNCAVLWQAFFSPLTPPQIWRPADQKATQRTASVLRERLRSIHGAPGVSIDLAGLRGRKRKFITTGFLKHSHPLLPLIMYCLCKSGIITLPFGGPEEFPFLSLLKARCLVICLITSRKWPKECRRVPFRERYTQNAFPPNPGVLQHGLYEYHIPRARAHSAWDKIPLSAHAKC